MSFSSLEMAGYAQSGHTAVQPWVNDASYSRSISQMSASEVTIVKRGRKLIVDVETRDESVHVSIPIRGVARLIERLGTGDRLI